MENEKISVIVPIYNVEQYLDECIKSIVEQDYKDLEIILVDDGSPDNSGRIIDDWAKKDPRIMPLHKQNGGLGDSRNYGFSHSTGDYIAYVDSDDVIDPSFFSKLMEALQGNDADMCGCRFYRNNVDGDGFRYPDPDESYRFSATTEEFLERLYNDFGVFCIACCKLYKRKVISDSMFPKVKIAEDAMVIRKLAYRCSKIAYIPDALYMYRDRPGSIMASERTYSLQDQKERMQWVVNDIEYYKSIGNNKLQALAEKAFCFYIFNDWSFFDKECKNFYKPQYYSYLGHMVCHKGNSLGSKCKYLLFGLRMLFG